MSKSKKKEKSSINKYLLPILTLVLVIVIALASFGKSILGDTKTQVINSYISTASNIAAIYDKEIYAVTTSSHVVANVISETEDLFSEDNKEMIKNMASVLSVANVYIVNTDYEAVDINGNKYVSITELPGYDYSFKGVNTVSKFIKNAQNESVMLICVPISTKLELKGYILAEYKPTVMDVLCSNVKYPKINTYALASSESYVIETAGADSQFVKKGEKLSNLSGVTFKKGTASTLKQNFTLLRTGYVEVANNSSDEYMFIYPIADYSACVVMSVQDSYIANDYAIVSKSVRNMLLTIGSIVGVFLLGVIGVFVFSRARYNLESENLQNKADTDQLTDLYNKMATERLIKEYLEGEGRDKVSMLFVLDVDNFKKINDTMGHAFGDEVLQSLGHQIRSWFRVNDIVGRIGGDEFMVFIKDVKDEAVIKREGSRIMQFFEGFTVGDYTRYSPTASVGGAVFPKDATDFESLYKAADKAVYKSKKGGKNRVSFYSDLNKTDQEEE